jgi:DNA replication and repair protein RecF
VRVDRFSSTSFRNLVPETIEFGPGLNLLVGANGQGKTNLLEAVYFFRFGRSFRAATDSELIAFEQPFCRAELAASFADGHRETFAFSIERRGPKSIKIDGQVLPRRSELAGRFPAVLFGPADLRVVSGEPENRRRFFDMVGTMTDPAYLRSARDYRRTLEQRNAALKARAGRDEIAAWNERLVASGVDLIVRRRDLVTQIEIEMSAHARDLESPFGFSMSYEASVDDGSGDDITQQAGLARVFHERLAAVAHEEARRGITLVGPHRDDVVFSLAGNDLRRFGSQGQRRLFAVLLKLAELSHLETELREPCVLLLDDVFAEFDAVILGKLQRMLDGARQVFITSPVAVGDLHVSRAAMFDVRDGRVSAA